MSYGGAGQRSLITQRGRANQKAGKYILAGITPADNVHDVIKVNPDDDSVDLLAEEINY
jgi:hypothetical protein